MADWCTIKTPISIPGLMMGKMTLFCELTLFNSLIFLSRYKGEPHKSQHYFYLSYTSSSSSAFVRLRSGVSLFWLVAPFFSIKSLVWMESPGSQITIQLSLFRPTFVRFPSTLMFKSILSNGVNDMFFQRNIFVPITTRRPSLSCIINPLSEPQSAIGYHSIFGQVSLFRSIVWIYLFIY